MCRPLKRNLKPRCEGSWSFLNEQIGSSAPLSRARCAVHQSSLRSVHTNTLSWSDLSKREFAALEDRLVTKVSSRVKDPVLQSDLRSLGWIQRRIVVSDEDGSVGLHLRLPTLMHPALDQLKEEIEKVSLEELQVIASEKGIQQPPTAVHVLATASPPIPIVARQADEHDEIIKKLGPGLAKVAHFLAVYSCKVGWV